MLAKNKSKWLDILKRFGLNWLPQNLTFNTEMTRYYHELQERDMEDLGGSQLPVSFSSQFLWNRDFSIRWDITKNLHMNFRSATHAEIEEPYYQINKDLYPTEYAAWKDSVWTSIKHMGTALDYGQTFTASYQLPLNLIPIFDWVNADASFNSSYNWQRGTADEDGRSYGNTINNNRQLNINGAFSLEKLYNHIPFLKKTNDRFNKTPSRTPRSNARTKNDGRNTKNEGRNTKNDQQKTKDEKALPKNKRAFEKEITLMPDTSIEVSHGKNSKRLMVSAKTSDGKSFKLKYKIVDQNKIKITSKVDSSTAIKIAVTAKEPLDNQTWYKTAQVLARGLMMVRNVSFTYRNQYAMALPGFLPNIGKAFGQYSGDVLSPGLDFAFGMIGDSYINKAVDNNWLLMSEDISTPATTNATEDL
jgi:cell surface protein SprA